MTVAALAEPAHGRGDGDASTPAVEDVAVLKASIARVSLRGPDALATPVWCYGGSVPGPVLSVRRGEELRLRLTNELPQPTTLHWHGVRAVQAMAGAALRIEPAAVPGSSVEYRFRAPDAGTFWYHAQRDLDPLAHGLYGAFVVKESLPVETDRDALLILDEWRLGASGAVFEPDSTSQIPRPLITVNGAPSVDVSVKTNERLRLRLINAALGRGFSLRFDRHRPVVMAIDGEPTEPFEARNGQVTLGPGNRLDLFIDTTLEAGDGASILLAQPTGETLLGRLVYDLGPPARATRRPDSPPLPPNPLPARMALETALRMDVPLEDPQAVQHNEMWSAAAPPPTPLVSVRQGRTVVLMLANGGTGAHVIHVHGHHFRLLDNLDDGWKPFWLDTVTIPGGQTLRVAFVAENPGAWLIERWVLASLRPALKSWFDVVPGHPCTLRSRRIVRRGRRADFTFALVDVAELLRDLVMRFRTQARDLRRRPRHGDEPDPQ